MDGVTIIAFIAKLQYVGVIEGREYRSTPH
jgi:hypothetical protein